MDIDGSSALALARSALARADDAHRIATSAVDHSLDTHQGYGQVLAKVAQLDAKVDGLEKLMRAGFSQLAQQAREAKREARKSGHDLAAWREDSTVTNLRGALEDARKRLDSIRARDKARRAWFWGIVASVIATVIATVLISAFHPRGEPHVTESTHVDRPRDRGADGR